ncbi:MAG: hypothetical protein L6244_03415 [Candidatus Methanoperedenaceae archaeon]|nr:hypothetical protein [Candidatus Methanoperedenaceae archaeon]
MVPATIPCLCFMLYEFCYLLILREYEFEVLKTYNGGFKGARKLPISIVEMNCPFA